MGTSGVEQLHNWLVVCYWATVDRRTVRRVVPLAAGAARVKMWKKKKDEAKIKGIERINKYGR